ncbi:GAF domain-containing sensor histidine kinase [Paenibacillus planticolens]|uniref:GAF domain-containing sensor histidine kinase n=1 Tax=Paenibacillus planticolens TaxID=2654976 RepID=UPI001C101A92|nr:GAF domain-containing sensor histidine kinase [Paenibacillus planticolens]
MKTIAETLNQANELESVLSLVLAKLLELTNLKAGWIFQVSKDPNLGHSCLSAEGIPEALARNEMAPLKAKSCWCIDRFRDGRLKHAVNILSCERLEEEMLIAVGDTEGISHHATIPLWAGQEMFGIMNVASPGKKHFKEEELALLQSVAFQIGTAIERTMLYRQQQKRAVHFAKLGEITRSLGRLLATEKIAGESVQRYGEAFDIPLVTVFIQEGNNLSPRMEFMDGKLYSCCSSYSMRGLGPIGQAFLKQETIRFNRTIADNDISRKKGLYPEIRSGVAVPIILRDEPIGVFFIGSLHKQYFDTVDAEVARAFTDHIALAYENARVYEQRRDLARSEERNRLARDLHDSVSQMLFSLNLTSRGLESMIGDAEPLVKEALTDIRQLSQNSLTEMRSLILQLRPAGLEHGLLTGLTQYGRQIGLTITTQVEGVRELPRMVEEALWRIGQEALNNVIKHARSKDAFISLCTTPDHVHFEVKDEGIGFTKERRTRQVKFGMHTMRERAEALGGSFGVQSHKGKGTTIQITFPLSIMKNA